MPARAHAGDAGRQGARYSVAVEIDLRIGRTEQETCVRRRGMVEATQTRTWMVERPLNDRDAVFNGGVQEILRFEPGMVELRVEAKHAHDIGLEAFAQLRTLPVDAKG